MTDEQIIKALECRSEQEADACEWCPLINNEWCSCVSAKNALDLINRQKAEIERFEECASREMLYEKVKSEAIKEFAERLCEDWRKD